MNSERYKQRLEEFGKALKQLEKAVEKEASNDLERDGTIQRFEFTYEMAWKAMKLWLESKDIDVRNALDTLKEALVQGLIDDGNSWSELHKKKKPYQPYL